MLIIFFFFFSSRRRHTRLTCDWSSDVCSSDLGARIAVDWGRGDQQGKEKVHARETPRGRRARPRALGGVRLPGREPFRGRAVPAHRAAAPARDRAADRPGQAGWAQAAAPRRPGRGRDYPRRGGQRALHPGARRAIHRDRGGRGRPPRGAAHGARHRSRAGGGRARAAPHQPWRGGAGPLGVDRSRRARAGPGRWPGGSRPGDRKSTRLNSSHMSISYAVFCLKKKKKKKQEKKIKKKKKKIQKKQKKKYKK